MATALISFGSNLGDRQATLDAAVEKLRQKAGVEQLVVSSYHATKPVGGPEGQDEFLNAAARLETSLSPRALLSELQRIERELGRVRQEHWGPRTIDLDLLLYDDQVINEPDLIVPHRFLAFRRFVLEPAVQVAGEMMHPELERTLIQLLKHVRLANRIFEVGGLIEPVRHDFARRVAESTGLARARRRFHSEKATGRLSVSVEFRTSDGMPLSGPLYFGFITDDFWLDIVHQPFVPVTHLSQLIEVLVKTPDAKFEPTALFQLDAPVDWLVDADPRFGEKGSDARRCCEVYRDQIARQLRQLRIPTLLLPADDLDRAVREAVAAIQAMS
jgi:2-amino-4-hydroxy-6-hydroxymethyldihydropteridine diphosphokinase